MSYSKLESSQGTIVSAKITSREPSNDSWVWGVGSFEDDLFEQSNTFDAEANTAVTFETDGTYAEYAPSSSAAVFGALLLSCALGIACGILTWATGFGIGLAFMTYCVLSVAFFFACVIHLRRMLKKND